MVLWRVVLVKHVRPTHVYGIKLLSLQSQLQAKWLFLPHNMINNRKLTFDFAHPFSTICNTIQTRLGFSLPPLTYISRMRTSSPHNA